MTLDQWIGLQWQLWSAFGPMVNWWLVFLLVGWIAAMLYSFGATFFSEWMNG